LGLIFKCRLQKDLEFLAPPEEVRNLGFMIIDGLDLLEDEPMPLVICQTPIYSHRKDQVESRGKIHIAGFPNGSIRKITPEQFNVLGKSGYATIHVSAKELPSDCET